MRHDAKATRRKRTRGLGVALVESLEGRQLLSATVSVTVRYGSEVVVEGSSGNDTIQITQSGGNLNILANGQTFTQAVPTAGLFIYTRGGSDSVWVCKSVTVKTTVEAIDHATTWLNAAGTNISAWFDGADGYTGTATIHWINSFAGGVTKAYGAALANPSDSGATSKHSISLWGSGPVANDINQGSIGDCYFLSSLAGFASSNPKKLRESAVDMGDGTYTVEFFRNGSPTYIRVSNDFSSGYFNGWKYAHPGTNNTMWAAVLEKAFCWFRYGYNTYSSISSGWMSEAFSALNLASTYISPVGTSEATFYSKISGDLTSGKAVTFGTSSNSDLVHGHGYTVISASKDSFGVTHYVVRNPWGSSGDALEDSHGYATLTFTDMVKDFSSGVMGA